MKFFKGIKDAFMEEVPDANNTNVQVAQPVQPAQSTAQPVVFASQGNPFAVQPAQPVISNEDKEKWQKYFSDVFTKAKMENVEYGQFLANMETVIETDPTLPDSNRFKMSFSFMRKAGITKEQLLAAVQNAVNTVNNDKKAIFDVDMAKRAQAIDNNVKLMQSKTDAIKKLTEEIQQLEAENQNAKEKIGTKTLCYNTLSNQLLEKIKNDSAAISNYIQ